MRRVLQQFRPGLVLAIFLLAPCLTWAQEAETGIAMPFTVSGIGMYTQRPQIADPSAASAIAGFRAMLYPSVKLGSHWFGYVSMRWTWR